MPAWPATLPDTLLQRGYSEQRQSAVVRSDNDAGPAKVRRRFTSAVRTISGTLTLPAALVETLDNFHVTDCDEGALAFDWTHPRTGVAATLRFTAPPIYSPLSGQYYSVALALEVLP